MKYARISPQNLFWSVPWNHVSLFIQISQFAEAIIDSQRFQNV